MEFLGVEDYGVFGCEGLWGFWMPKTKVLVPVPRIMVFGTEDYGFWIMVFGA